MSLVASGLLVHRGYRWSARSTMAPGLSTSLTESHTVLHLKDTGGLKCTGFSCIRFGSSPGSLWRRSEPIVLRGEFSQSYWAGHNNFLESFVFAPRLEPGISPQILAELDAAGIHTIGVFTEFGIILYSEDDLGHACNCVPILIEVLFALGAEGPVVHGSSHGPMDRQCNRF